MDRSDADDLRRRAATHKLIKGRRWRVSDPALDEEVRQMLVDVLMQARRSVKSALSTGDPDAVAAARRSVHDAKVALGERGPKWWQPMSADHVDERVASAIRSLESADSGTVDRAEVLRRFSL